MGTFKSIYNIQNDVEHSFSNVYKNDFLAHDVPVLFNHFAFNDCYLNIHKSRHTFQLVGRLPFDYPVIDVRKMYNVFKEDPDYKLIQNFFLALVRKVLDFYNDSCDFYIPIY